MTEENLIKPPRLKKGAVVGLVSPSGPVMSRRRFNEGKRFLESLSFKVKLGKHVLKKRGYMAGTDKERASDINDLFADEDIDAIFCTTGGMCANRILPLIKYDMIRKHPKIFVGFSNNSILLNSILTRSRMVTFHGPVVEWDFRWHLTPYTKKYMVRALGSVEAIGVVRELSKWQFLREGVAAGRLIGGNLRTLQSLIGTEYEPDWKDALFFWEAINLEPCDIDAKLTHFKLAYVFEKISGMIVGKLVGCESRYYKKSLKITDVIVDVCKEYDFPILYNVDLGHNKNKITIPIGVKAVIDSSKRLFSINETGVC